MMSSKKARASFVNELVRAFNGAWNAILLI